MPESLFHAIKMENLNIRKLRISQMLESGANYTIYKGAPKEYNVDKDIAQRYPALKKALRKDSFKKA